MCPLPAVRGRLRPAGQVRGKEALLAEGGAYFTTPHFDGYPAVLVRLDRIEVPDLTKLVVEAWLDLAPERLAKAYLAGAADG